MLARHFSLAVTALLSVNCASARVGGGAANASATIRSAGGATLGVLRLESVAGGVRLSGQLTGLSAGAHGIHFHAVGRCDAPGFTSAGGHFNPRGMQHGLANPEGPHAGDMPAIAAAANGLATVDHVTGLVSLSAGTDGLFDTDGTAIVVHATNDDQRTDPSGNSGARVACGVIQRS